MNLARKAAMLLVLFVAVSLLSLFTTSLAIRVAAGR
jgi:hypothetical protein